jgi:DNA (cytosine-5)-methyltransferase 1
MSAYYNEIDPFCIEVLKECIKQKVIADGVVDERPIQDVEPEDLREFTQHHFFAGGGGWSVAARMAGWPDDYPLFTASLPCQPFSCVGKKQGKDDERHLWPFCYRTLSCLRPPVIMGEQVSGKAGYEWFDQVASDLGFEGYATRAFDLTPIAVGGSQIRQRLWFVACLDSIPPLRIAEPRQELFSWSSEPEMGELAHDVPRRMDIMRILGNAICPKLACEVIKAFIEAEGEKLSV